MISVTNYRGFNIRLGQMFRFEVYEQGDDDTALFISESCQQAKDWIDEWHRRQTKTSRKQLQIELQTEEGHDVVVTGIHLGTSNLIGQRLKAKPYGRQVLYPRSSAVIELLSRRAHLEKQIEELNDDEEKVRIAVSRGYGRLGHDDYDKEIEKLEQDVAEARATAQELEGKYPGK